jgi:hypothetical protein
MYAIPTPEQIDELVELIDSSNELHGDSTDALREWQLQNNRLLTFGDWKAIRARQNELQLA